MSLTRRAFSAALAAAPTASLAQPRPIPLIIAHRGASGLRPEHTLMAYKLAIEQGANFIEPDLVVTKDKILVCRHEPEIADTTNVAALPQFADRKVVERTRDGREVAHWRAEDFTLAELSTLRARERLASLRPESAKFDGAEPPPSFQQVIDLAKREAARLGRPIGVYPELKTPAALSAKGFDTSALLLEALKQAGLPNAQVPVFIQCFEAEPLRRLKGRAPAPLVQLVQSQEMTTPQGMLDIASYAKGVGLEKSLVTPDVVRRAHDLGLIVHAWTFRAENQFLPADLRRGADPAAHGDMGAEVKRFIAMGVDGVFSDFPGLARAAL